MDDGITSQPVDSDLVSRRALLQQHARLYSTWSSTLCSAEGMEVIA